MNRLALLELMKRAALAAAKPNDPVEVRRYVRLLVTPKGAIVSAFDGQMYLTLTDSSITGELGPVLLDRNAIGVISDSAGEEITLSVEGHSLTIVSDSGIVSLTTCDPDRFPAASAVEGSVTLTVAAAELATALKRASCATDADGNLVGSVCIRELNGEELTIMATDSRRVSLMPLACEYAIEGDAELTDILIEPDIASRIVKLLPSDGPVVIRPGFDGGVCLTAGFVEAVFPCRHGRYPSAATIRDVCRLGEHAIEGANAGSIAAAIRLAAHTIDGDTGGVVMSVIDGLISFRSQSSNGNAAIKTTLTATGVPDMELRLSPQYLLDCLRAIGLDCECDIYLSDPESPVNVTLDDGYQYTLMPMAIS